MNKDTVVGIVGSVILVAAMVVVFAYERSNAQADDEDGLTPMVARPTISGSVDVGQSDTQTNNITGVGPSNLTFTLTWTAMQGSDTLRITVTPPPGSEGITAQTSQEEDDGSITLRVAIPEDYADQGLWTVKVDFTRAEADPSPVPGLPPMGMTDDNVSYSVAVTLA